MNRTDQVWEHFDKAFAEADKAFAEASKLFHDLPPSATQVKTALTHQLHFEARSAAERGRLARRFFKMALTVLFTGKTHFSFKHR